MACSPDSLLLLRFLSAHITRDNASHEVRRHEVLACSPDSLILLRFLSIICILNEKGCFMKRIQHFACRLNRTPDLIYRPLTSNALSCNYREYSLSILTYFTYFSFTRACYLEPFRTSGNGHQYMPQRAVEGSDAQIAPRANGVHNQGFSPHCEETRHKVVSIQAIKTTSSQCRFSGKALNQVLCPHQGRRRIEEAR